MNKSVDAKLELAKMLHESTRAHVANFREWDELDTEFACQKVFLAQAQALIDTYAMLPLDNTRACSGCRTLTNALNDMDESRRQLIHHREVLVAMVGASDPEELKAMKTAIAASEAPAEDKGAILAAIYTLMEPITGTTPAVTQEVPL